MLIKLLPKKLEIEFANDTDRNAFEREIHQLFNVYAAGIDYWARAYPTLHEIKQLFDLENEDK